jgi:hypothetical protein
MFPGMAEELECMNDVRRGVCGGDHTNEIFVTIRGPFEKFVYWLQYAAVMQREAVTVMPSCSGGGNVVVA